MPAAPLHPLTLDKAIDTATRAMLACQRDDGHWVFELEADTTIPAEYILLKHYLRLGGRMLGFNVDPNFSNVVDGLILVDLTQTDVKILERFVGKDQAATYLAYHRDIELLTQ